MDQPDLVIVEWLDATSSDAWLPFTDFQPELVPCVEIGLLISCTDESITLSSGWNGNGSLSNRTTIPRSNIRKVEVLAYRAAAEGMVRMPWTPSQAKEKTHKANSPKKERQWRDIANSVLSKTGDEARAIRTANGVIKKGSKSAKR